MRILDVFVVLTIVLFPGCAPNDAPPVVEESQTAESSNLREDFPRLRWTSIEVDGNESLSTAGPVIASDKGFQILEDKFHQLDWNNPLLKPSITVDLAEDRSLTIRLSGDSTSDRPELIAVQREAGPRYGNTTTMSMRRSQPLIDGDQALALLRSYIQNDDEFESLVEWVEHGSSANDSN